jgi:radical SAM-linked protein
MERAFRVTQLPLAFSEGFSPRPKVSFGLALSTGHESDAEYLDLEFLHEVDCDDLPPVLSEALPDGMAVVAAAPLVERAPALQEAVTAVVWQVEVVRGDGTPATPAVLDAYVEAALAAPELPTERHKKGREVVEDVRPVIRRIDVEPHAMEVGDTGTALVMELSTQPRSAKPGEILTASRVNGAPDDRQASAAYASMDRARRHAVGTAGCRHAPAHAESARVMREGSNGRVRTPRRVGHDDRYIIIRARSIINTRAESDGDRV